MSSLTRKVITLGPREPREEAVQGSIVFIQRATGPFQIKLLPSGELLDAGQGVKIKTDKFKRLLFQNPGLSSLDITYWAGDADVDFFPDSTLKDAETVNVGSGVKIMNGGGTPDVYTGTLNGVARRSIVVQNLDDTTPLYLQDQNHHVFASVSPGQPWARDMSGYIEVAPSTTNNAVSVNYVVGEVFYLP